MSWTHSSVAGTESYALKKTEYIVKFPTPMTLKTGDSVVATVDYDLSAAIQIGAEAASGDNIDCVNDNTANKTQTCATMPALTIGVTAATK